MSLDARVGAPFWRGLSPRDAAVFLDFDGTLVEIAPTPDAVAVPDALVSLLAVLDSETEGACAIVTGRPVADLRRHLPLVPWAVIGSHGAEGDLPGAPAYRHPMIGSDRIANLHDRASRAGAHDGVVVERKPTGIAIHYRAAPGEEAAIKEFARALVTEFVGFVAIFGKCVVEVRPAGVGKDLAIARAMDLAVFAGRTPVFFGDDVTDEPALAWVAQAGGVSVRVGPGESVAEWRLPGPADVHEALADWLEGAWSRA